MDADSQLWHRQRSLIIVACGILLLAAYYFMIFLPQQQMIAALQHDCQLLQQDIASIEDFAAQHPDPDKFRQELHLRARLVDGLLPHDAGLGVFIKDAECLAKASGISIVYIKPTELAVTPELIELPLEIRVIGPYFATLDFCERMQKQRLNSLRHAEFIQRNGTLETALVIALFCKPEQQMPK